MQPLSQQLTTTTSNFEKPPANKLGEEQRALSVSRMSTKEYTKVPKKTAIERRIELAPDTLKMLCFNLGTSWVDVANKLKFTEFLIENIQAMYTSKKEWKIRFNDLLESSTNDGWYVECHDPKIIDAISFFISKALEMNDLDVLFSAIEETNYHLAQCVKKTQLESSSAIQLLGSELPPRTSKFSSYIFLQWVKQPERVTKWGHIIPNTKILPHQQTVYDWALLNPDKVVVLWFDSCGLTSVEVEQYYGFERTTNSYIDNIIVLDVRNITWSDVSLNYYEKGTPVVCKTTNDVLTQHEFTSLGDRLDFIRERLLYEGSCAIVSALKKTSKRLDLLNSLPSCGIYFDLDFIPIEFSSSEIHNKPIYIDDTLRNVSGYMIEHDGTVHFGGHFSNSLIAVSQDHLEILGEYLKINLQDNVLPYYSGLSQTLEIFRHKVGGTRSFRMSGSAHLYRDNYLPEWAGSNAGTWKKDDRDRFNTQENQPIQFRRAKYLEV